MLSAKQKLISALDFIGENEAEDILLYIKQTFILKPRTWDDIEEDDPSSDEMAAFDEYRASDTHLE